MSKEINNLQESIIDELKRVRLARGYSHYKVAELTGLNRTAIGHIEGKKRNPTLLTCLKIAEALEVDLGKIISEQTKN
jgi:putative transcriptional regulator